MPENNIITFQQDTAERKRFFKAGSFAHPAKMILGLQIYLIEHYTKPGETILDPMSGSGTILVACALGRHVICVELEEKFIKMIEGNWEKIKSLGPMLGFTMGEATILQGDARALQGLLVDKIVTSPPFGKSLCGNGTGLQPLITSKGTTRGRGYSSFGESTCKEYAPSTNNIGNLPYGEISVVISSQPYPAAEAQLSADKVADPEKFAEISSKRFKQGKKKGHFATKEAILRSMEKRQKGCGDNPDNISKLPYKADAVITSPPYEGSGSDQSTSKVYTKWCEQHGRNPNSASARAKHNGGYAPTEENIGNLKSDNYLEAMLAVYHQCHKVLKDGGLLCLVVKNFIRDKKIVRLDLDTIKLCENAGFVLKERLKRKLTQQSFWRTIYYKKFPEVEKIEFEDVLIFAKGRIDIYDHIKELKAEIVKLKTQMLPNEFEQNTIEAMDEAQALKTSDKGQ